MDLSLDELVGIMKANLLHKFGSDPITKAKLIEINQYIAGEMKWIKLHAVVEPTQQDVEKGHLPLNFYIECLPQRPRLGT